MKSSESVHTGSSHRRSQTCPLYGPLVRRALVLAMISTLCRSVPTTRGFSIWPTCSYRSVARSVGPTVSPPRTCARPTASLSATQNVDTANTLVSSTTTTDESPPAGGPKPKVRRILSGVQPTGVLHLGNYLGAIQQWVHAQNTVPTTTTGDGTTTDTRPMENFFCVVDLHAITIPQRPADLTDSTRTSAALYLAAGIDPSKSKIFVQSHVSAHAELTWLLQCMTPMNWLERMIQYKEKARKQGESVGAGLLTYPVLMAADILLYQAEEIPVGEDQRQHLELARDLCRRFHDLYGKPVGAYKKRMAAAGLSSRPVFTEPTAKYQTEGSGGAARVMSLTDGTRKMSKSDASDYSRINLLDPPDLIRDKIKKCKTDDITGLEWDNPNRPEATNLLSIYAAVLPPGPDHTPEAIAARVSHLTWGEFKPLLAEALVQHLQPIQERYAAIRANGDASLDAILADGAAAANAVASQTLVAAKTAMGLVVPPSVALPSRPTTLD